ncbi:MAG TPA: OmpA family protein [Rhizomicrobium sp.]|nr:OmpA family protein [Rhizomicrobium sp.]
MQTFRVLIIAGAALAAGPAVAQMYPGQGVTVNPSAAGTRVLLYPGNQYVRVVPPLMEPGAKPLEPIHLHWPPAHRREARIHHHHAAKVATDTTAAPAADASAPAPDESAAQTPPPAPAHREKKKQKTEVAAAPDTSAGDTPAPADSGGSDAAIPFSFGGPAPVAPARATPKRAQNPAKVATATAPAAASAQAPDQPQPGKTMEDGFVKRGEILFKHDATDPAPAQYDGLKLLAGDLNAALQSGATRIHLNAFGGAPGDKGSDARRLSLKRALAIRQVLIDNGVPSGKIDVSAKGGVDDHGNADRVDVLIQGG